MAAITTRDAPGRLRRILGISFGLAVTIGGTLGVGILRAPGLVAGQLGDAPTILVAWIAGGLYTLLGALCLAELGTMTPRAGGYFVHARRAFGDRVGFAVGWSDWVTYCAVLGYLSIAMAEFLAELVPPVAALVKPIAIAILVGFVGLQWAGLRVSSRFQEWTTALKCLAFLVLIGAALLGGGSSAPAGPPAEPPAGMTLAGVIAALQAVVITYGGWQSALYFTEEDRDPIRHLPRAMIGGVLLVLVLYALVNLALLAVLPVADLARSTLPAADAAERMVGESGGRIITALCVVSLLPILNAVMMIGTRILFALGRDGLFWSRTQAVNAGGTPGLATLITTGVAVLLIATGTFQRLIAMAAFFLAVNYAVCCVALVVLRRREPDAERPLRAWGYPWSAAIVIAGAIAFLAGALIGDTVNAAAAVGLLVVGLAGRALLQR